MIKYRSGYKYQLHETVSFNTPIIPDQLIDTKWMKLTVNGVLTVYDSYCWDGASGPTLDWPKNKVLTPSLVHDAFCQLIREKQLPSIARRKADKHFYHMLRERKMNPIRSWIWYRGVRFGARHIVQTVKKIKEAL